MEHVDWILLFAEIHRDEDKTPVILTAISVGGIVYIGNIRENNHIEITSVVSVYKQTFEVRSFLVCFDNYKVTSVFV
jgi:lysyl-tRNA synthetase class I